MNKQIKPMIDYEARSLALLQAKVRARNLVHAILLEYTPKLQLALSPWLGKKVVNAGGIVSERVRAALHAAIPEDSQDMRCLIRAGSYTVSAAFRVMVSYDQPGKDWPNNTYAEQSTDLGELEGDILKKLCPTPSTIGYPTDYTVEAVKEARIKLRKAQDVVSAAASSLRYFGEFDN